MKVKQCDRWWGKKHTWSKWQETSRATVNEFSSFKPELGWYPVGFAIIQERTCELCGYKQIERNEVLNH